MAKVLHLCNPGAADAAFDEVVPITSMAELNEKRDQDIEAWFVFAHLDWDRSKLSQNYGFDVAQRIRMEFGSMAPIIFYSPIKEEYFTSLPGWKYKILNGCGSTFLPSGSTTSKAKFEELLKSTAALTPTSLLDVVTMLCNVRGLVVDRLNHDLKPEKPSEPVFKAVEPLLSNVQKDEIGFDRYREEFAKVDRSRNKVVFMKLRRSLILDCDGLLPKKVGPKADLKSKDRTKPHILLLEDDPQYRVKVKKALSKAFVVHDVATSTEAIQVLNKDKAIGDIRAVICDWRLFEYRDGTKTERWQRPQGYGVLEYAATMGTRALYALTSQDDRLVHAIRNLSDRRYALFKKEHLQGAAQWELLLDVIDEGCQQALIDRADKVVQGFKGWVNTGKKKVRSKQEAYVEIWNSVDRVSFYDEVTALANKAWRAYCAGQKEYLVGKFPTELGYSANANDRSDMKKFFALRRLYFGIWIDQGPPARPKAGELAAHRDQVERVLWGASEADSTSVKRSLLCINFEAIAVDRMFDDEVAWLLEKKLEPDKLS